MNDNAVHEKLLEYFYSLSKTYEVVAVMLYGSQNYRLDTPESDIDAKAIVLPKFDDFVLNKKLVSTTKDFGSDGQVDVKDIRLMFDCFRKQNINFVELLHTKFYVVNKKYLDLMNELFNNAENISRYNNYAAINCMRGMAMEKLNALKHPYPTIVHKIEKFGYDPKQLHHILRIEDFMKKYISGQSYKDCLIPSQPDYLKSIKAGALPLLQAEVKANSSIERINNIRDDYMSNNPLNVDKSVDDFLNDFTLRIMKKFFKEQLKEK